MGERFYSADEKCQGCGGDCGFTDGIGWMKCDRCNGVGLEPYEFVQVGWYDDRHEIEEFIGHYPNNPNNQALGKKGWEPVGRMEKVPTDG